MTIFAPAARHFLVHASALSLAPLAPHLSSLTHPLTVLLLPISSNAIAVRANTKQIARQSTRTFLMDGFLLFDCAAGGPTPQVIAGSIARPAGRTGFRRSPIARTIAQVGLTVCHCVAGCRPSFLHCFKKRSLQCRFCGDYFFVEWLSGGVFTGGCGT